MVDKPKTYAQQVQELKAILLERDEEINVLKQNLSSVEEMRNEIAHLRSKLEERDKVTSSDFTSSKATLTDLQQRAESAEKNVREIKALYSQLDAQNNALRNLCYDNVSKFDDKIEKLEINNSQLANELLEEKAKNRGLSLQLRDMRNEFINKTGELEKQLSYSKQVNQVLEQRTQKAEASLQALKDFSKELEW